MSAGIELGGISLPNDPLLSVVVKSQSAFFVTDLSKERKILYSSPAFDTLVGYAASDLKGRSFQFMRDASGASDSFDNLLEKEECNISMQCTRKSGSKFASVLYFRPLANEDGMPKYYLCLVEVSEDKSAKIALDLNGTSADLKPNRTGALAVEPLVLEFNKLSCHVIPFMGPDVGKEKEILHEVSGIVRPGETLAILGPSGSGKTTLLNSIAGRVAGRLEGSILMNGQRRNKAMKRRIGYVLQDDNFFHKLTVRETLTFTALLRLPSSLTKAEKLQRVDGVIEALGLRRCENTVIGNWMMGIPGISGGEKKRLNIAVELLNQPSLVLLDEPTSGLDSTTALSLMTTLRDLSSQGRTVVATIHQPSSQLYALFDKVMLMADGDVLYFGPAKKAVPYFASVGYPCQIGYNASDFMLDLATLSGSDGVPHRKKLAELWRQRIQKQPLENTPKANDHAGAAFTVPAGKEVEMQVMSPTATSAVSAQAEPAKKGRKWPTSFAQQFMLLSIRSYKQRRGEVFEAITVKQIFISAWIAGLAWWQTPYTEAALRDRIGVLFFTIVFWAMHPLFTALMAFPAERALVNKERASGAYRLSAFFLAKTLSELPVDFVFPTMFVTIVYWTSGLAPDAGRFFALIGLVLLATMAGQSFGLLISAYVSNMKTGLVVATVTTLAMMLVGGYYIDFDNLPDWIHWIRYLSFISYMYEATMLNEFDGRSMKCSGPTDKPLSSIYSKCPVPSGEVLDSLGVEHTMGFNVGLLCLYIVIMRVLAYLALRYKNRPPQAKEEEEEAAAASGKNSPGPASVANNEVSAEIGQPSSV